MSGVLFESEQSLVRNVVPLPSALETDFPAGDLSDLALKESWRKEVHRPATSTHKWWAKRLGTIFRGIIASAVSENADDAVNAYSSKTSMQGITVLDPFAGSGTTAVEAVKLGARAISFDINPVATLVQRQALQPWDVASLSRSFDEIERRARKEIDRVHRTEDGRTVLYYFWVALANCPVCSETIRLFNSTVFSSNAYPKRVPKAQVVCPVCLDIQENRYDFDVATCQNGHVITHKGAVSGASMVCSSGHRTKVTSGLGSERPRYEMYAKLVANPGGSKTYEGITQWDRDLYAECEDRVLELSDETIFPTGGLEQGNNTRQAMAWNFREWRDFFNARQLYSLSILATAVAEVEAPPAEREALCALFSGTLEFNNLFCSFKGEGTGAVRHMFAHHVLRPERTPLEAHPWGTSQSSGSFSTLFKSRILRAHEYKTDPVDLVHSDGAVVRKKDISWPLETKISTTYDEFCSNGESNAYIATRNSAATDLPDACVDLVVTDPPYMDNVHYAELADFFHAWLNQMSPFQDYGNAKSTRAHGEVQQSEPAEFGRAIQAVWTECVRVLKPNGLVAFTFHQARLGGWVELIRALRNSGLRVTAIQPVKGEMTTSITKGGAKEPSNLDSVVVCRKVESLKSQFSNLDQAYGDALQGLSRLIQIGVDIGPGDVRSVIRGSLLAYLAYETDSMEDYVESIDQMADQAIVSLLPTDHRD